MLSTAGDNQKSPIKIVLSTSQAIFAAPLDHVSLSTAGYKPIQKPHEFEPGPLAHRL
jgi:hypothetical protein